MSERPAARPTRRSARTRERIIEAATEVFARRGVHGTRVADIAERAGIAYGLVYHHFRNKEDILTAIFAERWAQYVAYLEEVERMPVSFRERMRKLIHFWVETYRHETELMTVMINEITRSSEFLESHDIGSVLVSFDPIERIIAEGRRNGEVRSDLDPKLAAYAVLGVAEMVLTGYVVGSLPRADPEAYARDEEQLLGLLIDGMRT
ncbi:MAG: TetR/AcrR family transcriptional regulator [Candidatus Dormibacteraeota bacterium]|nr:TetR/AcrR family transcriptional regulator [Candidatus Dormibacteraeota bacterium]